MPKHFSNDKKKIYVFLEDDNEILGNGQGHTMLRQYLPTKRYVEMLNKYNIKSTFYVDMAHYLFLKENCSHKDFKFQAKVIEETILLLQKNKMDIQLHIHSQWHGAKILDNKIYVTKKWNIGQLNNDVQEELISKSYEALDNLLNNTKKSNTINSFKAGSWGAQPFETLHKTFTDKGIKLVLGPVKGLKIPKLEVDYTKLHSSFFPYYASAKNINLIDSKSKVIVLPMTPTYLNLIDLVRYFFETKISKIFKKNNFVDLYDLDQKIKNLKPLIGKDEFNFKFNSFKTHLKMNAQKFWYLKKTFNRSYNLIKNSKFNYKLIVIESHTKDFSGNFHDVELFIKYLKSNFEDLEFVTATEILRHIKDGKLNPLSE